jgi:type IV pilus assembly protein PilA
MPQVASAGFSAVATNIIQSLTYSFTSATQGQITLAIKAIGGATVAGNTLIFTGTGSSNGVSWTCTSGTLSSKYRPANCR